MLSFWAGGISSFPPCARKYRLLRRLLVLHFTDSDINITEEFIRFLQCKWGLSGVQLSKLIVDALNDLTLRIVEDRDMMEQVLLLYGAPNLSKF